ncbi:hypothetical protein BDZ89DRAFT_1054496 [Hymenopellis radicata]|nr:hypothetical protein BDZ89DRAFT_1054496 [Hymenopellis radicata]
MKADFDTAVAAKNTQSWARRVTVGYWIRYAGVDLNEDLDELPTVPSAAEVKEWEDKNSADLDSLSQEERKAKSAEQGKFVQKIIQWFRTQFTQVRKDEAKELMGLLKKSNGKTTGMRHQQLVETFTQVYWETSFVRGDPTQTLSRLHQLELDRLRKEDDDAYAAVVKLAKDAGEEPPPPLQHHPALKITSENLLKVSPEVKAHLQNLNEQEYQSRKGDDKEGDDEEKSDFATWMSHARSNILEGIASIIEKKYGAVCTILLAGQLREESRVHAGKALATGANWPTSDPTGYSMVEQCLINFGEKCFGFHLVFASKVDGEGFYTTPTSITKAAPTTSPDKTAQPIPVPVLRKGANAQLIETLALLVEEERNTCIDLINEMSMADFAGEKAYAERALKLWPYKLATRISPSSVMFGRKVNPGVVVDCVRVDEDEVMHDSIDDQMQQGEKATSPQQDLPPPREPTLPPREATPPPREPTLPPREATPPPPEPTLPPREPTPPPPEPTLPPREPTLPPREPTLPPQEPTPPPREATPPPPEPTLPPREPTLPPREATLPPREPTPPPPYPTPIPEQPLPTSLAKDAEDSEDEPIIEDDEWDDVNTSQFWPELRDVFEACKRGRKWSQDWSRLIDSFLVFEKKHGYEDNAKVGLGGISRPSSIHAFQKGRRLWSKSWDSKDTPQTFWPFWKSLQPAARLNAANELLRPEEVEWDGLETKCGRNGVSLIIGVLLWWGDGIFTDGQASTSSDDTNSQRLDWGLAVQEVTWSLDHMVRTAKFKKSTSSGKRTSPSEPEVGGPQCLSFCVVYSFAMVPGFSVKFAGGTDDHVWRQLRVDMRIGSRQYLGPGYPARAAENHAATASAGTTIVGGAALAGQAGLYLDNSLWLQTSR